MTIGELLTIFWNMNVFEFLFFLFTVLVVFGLIGLTLSSIEYLTKKLAGRTE